MIDPHVHLRDWNQAEKETVAHGLALAAACGFTHVFDMPNTDPPLTSRETVLKRLELAATAEAATGVAYHLWLGLTVDPAQIAEMVETYRELHPRTVGMKLFLGHSTGNMGICEVGEQRAVLQTLTALGYRGVVAVHAEKESRIRPELYAPGRFETHSAARPPEAEIESVRDILAIAEETGFAGTLHVAHISTQGALEQVRAARAAGRRITCGVTPHHALYTSADAAEHDRYLKMNPPLRGEADRKAVFTALLDGTADWMESDHAPHTKAQKEAGASGIPGLENMLLLIAALKAAGITEDRLRAVTFGNAARIIGL